MHPSLACLAAKIRSGPFRGQCIFGRSSVNLTNTSSPAETPLYARSALLRTRDRFTSTESDFAWRGQPSSYPLRIIPPSMEMFVRVLYAQEVVRDSTYSTSTMDQGRWQAVVWCGVV